MGKLAGNAMDCMKPADCAARAAYNAHTTERPMTHGIPQSLIDTLTAYADQADAETTWPAASLDALGQAGVWRWSIPTQYGGDGLGGVELLRRYRDLASACLTTAFILSQREA